LLSALAGAQETRSAIFGRVLDSQSAAVPDAGVTVVNVDTNTTVRVKTNETGYYEANLLLPGSYTVTVEVAGFKTVVRKGIVLPIATRSEVDLSLAVGAISDSIVVQANAIMLDTESGSAGKALSNREIMDLPNMENNAVLLAQLAPGIQTSGTTAYMGLHSNMGSSDYEMYGNIGGNDWSLDGAPDIGQQRRMAYLPYNDAIAEFKVDTTPFDASFGHSTGVGITMMTKSGTNDFHGTANWQYWNARWNGTPFFSNKTYYTNLYAAEAAGNASLVKSIEASGSQPPGHSHNYAGTIGGPVRIPKLFNGKNKLFFFAEYNGFRDLKTDDPTTFNHTVPTLPERTGDFSDLLKVTTNTAIYQIYDPLSTIPDTTRSGHIVRTPFPNNVIPSSRLVDPIMKYYTNLMPAPNVTIDPTVLPTNNYFAGKTPYNWDFNSVTNRYDYNLNDRHRLFARWTFESWKEDRNDWLYETAPGLNSDGQIRRTMNGSLGWTWTAGAATVVDATVSINEYQEGNSTPVATAIKPSDVGLPTYMDTQAGGFHMIPYLSITNYTSGQTSSGYYYLPYSYPSITHYRTSEQRINLTRIMGKHSLHTGVDLREYFKTGGGGGQTSGSFTFNNTYMQRTDDGYTPASNYGLAWASLETGFPASYSEGITTPLALSNKYLGMYVSDSWRVSSKFTLTLGLRAEYETGATERHNRLLYYDPKQQLGGFATDVQNAYSAVLNDPANASNTGVQLLKQYLPVSGLSIQGGTVYPGVNGEPRNVYKNELMWLPRIGWAYQLNSSTVLRGGYGLYYDTNNVLPTGYSSGTFNSSTNNPALTNDMGQTWNVGNPTAGVSSLSDPFPAIYNGQRFIGAVGTTYGQFAQVGSGPTYTDYDWEHARQQRWRFSAQRQFGSNLMLEVAYDGSYSDQIGITKVMSAVPAQFWNYTSGRNDAVASAMSASVPNPFLPANFADIKTGNPTLYTNILNSSGFFTSKTIQVSQLVRPFEQMNGLKQSNVPAGLAKTHSLTVNLNRRFANGFTLNFGYTRLSTREATGYSNDFNSEPYWRLSNNGRPTRVAISGVYEIPFGSGRKFLTHGIPSYALGGWKLAATYQYQPGPLITWTTTSIYNGNPNNICSGSHSLSQWFNTSGFVTSSALQTTSDQVQIFPYVISGCRSDNTNLINGSVMRDFKIFREGKALQIRLDALNATNHPQFSGPTTSPSSSTFGQVTSQSSQINRLIEITAHIRF
jgi:hypothetical protein